MQHIDQVDRILIKYSGREDELFTALRQKYLRHERPAPEEWRRKLTLFYKQHNPANMQKVDQILAQHHGREEQLFATLRQKCVPVLTAGPLL